MSDTRSPQSDPVLTAEPMNPRDEAVIARHDHEHRMTPCPEWDVLVSEPFDIDRQLDDAIRAALEADRNPQETER